MNRNFRLEPRAGWVTSLTGDRISGYLFPAGIRRHELGDRVVDHQEAEHAACVAWAPSRLARILREPDQAQPPWRRRGPRPGRSAADLGPPLKFPRSTSDA